MITLLYAFVLSYLSIVNSNPVLIKETGSAKCGYASCPKTDPTKINVHLICHTHDDVGWLKTVEQYYYGSNNTIQRAGVQYIFDTVIKELVQDPTKRFIYVETMFFWKWWKQQDKETKSLVYNLVQQGKVNQNGFKLIVIKTNSY